jgi:signal transduction histidine kinase
MSEHTDSTLDLNSGSILVVDDNRMNRTKLSISLRQQGHDVALAEDGEQALEMLDQASYDLVLLDIIMPGIDGYEVLERMKNNPSLRHIPVIVISALDEVDSAVRCIEIGAEDYLPKPFNPVLLKARLNASLQKKKLRDLESAYLKQELMLRQNEKLVTLGKLSAGMAHELNNPSAAVVRGAAMTKEAFTNLQMVVLKLAELDLSEQQRSILASLEERARTQAGGSLKLDSLLVSDREQDIESFLETHAVDSAWEIAPNLVDLDFQDRELTELALVFPGNQFEAVISYLNCAYVIYHLLVDIGEASSRVSEIVGALKTYSYMDQAPIQEVDIHKGLDNTLVIMASKLKDGIRVHRQYADDLPLIQAYGSELNQVWTNLIDNAIDAVNGDGEITIRTGLDDSWVVVEVVDNGEGIPEEVQGHLFEPFFTTKPPGQGVGLGLNISYNTIVQKHQGKIEVESQPGETRFIVRLPVACSPV